MAAFIILVLICLSCLVISIETNQIGFSVELIHRDSTRSPFYNPDQSSTQRLVNAFHRSVDRAHHFSLAKWVTPSLFESQIVNSNGDYLMRISIGTPPIPILAYADTGNDLMWTQCEPCNGCYKQVDPLFNPKSSSTYKDLNCASEQCKSLPTGCFSNGSCLYALVYEDKSLTIGNLATDTISLNSTNSRLVSFPTSVFGCGHNNTGLFNEKSSGVVGLGSGLGSLIKQMGSSIEGKFSYCLTSQIDNSSAMNFGKNAIVSGVGVQSTPLIIVKNNARAYYLTLEAMSVGNERIEFSSSAFGTGDGNIIIDSGATFTFVPHDFFNHLAMAVDKVVKGQRVDDPDRFSKLCYTARYDLKVPQITVNFKGADVKLDPSSVFFTDSTDVVCFSINPNDIPVFGNMAQINLLVGYDLEKGTVSFKSFDCTKA